MGPAGRAEIRPVPSSRAAPSRRKTIPAGQRVASNLTPEEAANPPQEVAQQLVNGDYPRNSKGETYGSMTLSDYTGYRPDLIAVGTTEGGSGYVTYEDWEDGGYLGYPGDRNNLGEAYEEWCRNMPTDYLIPVYDVEHEQVVGGGGGGGGGSVLHLQPGRLRPHPGEH